MFNIISRRDFLKATSTIGLAAAINPGSAATAATKKSRVVIATDTSTVTSTGSPVAAKIQDLVDNAIMTFTGKSKTAEAYEALFPAPITNSTKICIKRNDASGDRDVNKAVTAAFQKGLESMLNGAFPKANIDNPYPLTRNANQTARTTAATYIINCPVAWVHSVYGVTLSLKNQMNYLGDPFTKFHNADKSWLHTVALDPAIKPKQVLSLMDACVGNPKDGPVTSPTFAAGTLIVSNDLVAVDYNTIRLMEKQKNPNSSYLSMGDSQLKAAEAAGLGTCTPANMDIITIKPPWNSTVGLMNGSETLMKSMNIRVVNNQNRVEFAVPGASERSMAVAIFDMMGNVIWQSGDQFCNAVFWNKTTMHGTRVPSAMYIFRIACNGSIIRGTVMVTH
jgi:hypothetical protein